MKTVAFQGVPGAYSEMAALKFFGSAIRLKPCKDFPAVFRALSRGTVRHAVIPIENSLAGSIHQNYDLLMKHRVWIHGEHKLRVSHNLLVLPGTKKSDIRRVYSHPQALAQCEGYLRRMKKVEPVPHFDTAGSARFLSETREAGAAAIASEQAARDYGLKILQSSIEDNEQNFTRFLVLEKAGGRAPRRVRGKSYKTSIAFALRNIPGCLHKCLSVFAIRDIDLFKIESRPMAGTPWKYIFYLDFCGDVRDEAPARALEHLQEITEYYKLLGSYPESG